MTTASRTLAPAPAEPHGHAHPGHSHHAHVGHSHAAHDHDHGDTPAASRTGPQLSLIALSGFQRLGLVLPAIAALWLLTFWAMSHG